MLYKVLPNGPAGVIPAYLLQSSVLTLGARMALYNLMSHRDGYKGFGLGQMCRELDINKTTALRHLQELKEFGFLTTKENFGTNRRQLASTYTVYGKSLLFPSWVFRVTTDIPMSMKDYRKQLRESAGNVEKFPLTQDEIKGKVEQFPVAEDESNAGLHSDGKPVCNPPGVVPAQPLNNINKDGALPSPPAHSSPAAPHRESASCARHDPPMPHDREKVVMTHVYSETVELKEYLKEAYNFMVEGHKVTKWINKAILRGSLTLERAKQLKEQGKGKCDLSRYELQKYLKHFAENYDKIVEAA